MVGLENDFFCIEKFRLKNSIFQSDMSLKEDPFSNFFFIYPQG